MTKEELMEFIESTKARLDTLEAGGVDKDPDTTVDEEKQDAEEKDYLEGLLV